MKSLIHLKFRNIRVLAVLILFIVSINANSNELVENNKITKTENTVKSSKKSKEGGPPSKKELIGYWKMVALPNPKINKENPWPLPYQWFFFNKNGKVYSMMMSDDKSFTSTELKEIFEALPEQRTPNYKLKGQFIFIDNPEIENYQEKWGANIFAEDFEDFALKGDLIMTLDDGSGNVIYYRLLRRVK